MPPKKKTEATGIEALIGKKVRLADRYGTKIPKEVTLKQVTSEWVTLETESGATTCINRDFLSAITEVRETETN